MTVQQLIMVTQLQNMPTFQTHFSVLIFCLLFTIVISQKRLTCSATFQNFLRASKLSKRQPQPNWGINPEQFLRVGQYIKYFLIVMLCLTVTMGLCFYFKDETIYKRYLKQYDGKKIQTFYKLMNLKIDQELFQNYEEQTKKGGVKLSQEEKRKNIDNFFSGLGGNGGDEEEEDRQAQNIGEESSEDDDDQQLIS